MKILDSLNLQDAKHLLHELRRYADMKKKLGNRGAELFVRELNGKHKFVVEYFPILGEKDAWAQAQHVFQKCFGDVPAFDEVVFIPREEIRGGMKVYRDDTLVDLSFAKVERLLQS